MPTVAELINKAKDSPILKLSQKRLTSIPIELIDLINLQIAPNVETLNLKSNFIVEIQDELNGYRCLITLILTRNHLSIFPSLSGLSNLQKLYLDFNKFTEFPTSVYQLKSLTELYLQNNKIERIPTDIGELKNLKRLDMSNNNLTAITTHLYDCKLLEVLNFANNDIVALPDGIHSLSELKEINMENNEKLECIPSDLGKVENLSIFLCKNCPKMNYFPISMLDVELEKYSFDQTFVINEEHLSHSAATVVKYLNVLQKLNLKFDSKAHWKADELATACFRCQSVFGFKLRRHHCRLCGEIYCFKCCTEKYSHPKLGFSAVKICQQCNQEIQTPIINEIIPSGAFHSPDRFLAMTLQSSSSDLPQTNIGKEEINNRNISLHQSIDVRKKQIDRPIEIENQIRSIHHSLDVKIDDQIGALSSEFDDYQQMIRRIFELTEEEMTLNFFKKKEIVDQKLIDIEKLLVEERKKYDLAHSPLSLFRIQEIGKMKEKLNAFLEQMNVELKNLLLLPPPPPPPLPSSSPLSSPSPLSSLPSSSPLSSPSINNNNNTTTNNTYNNDNINLNNNLSDNNENKSYNNNSNNNSNNNVKISVSEGEKKKEGEGEDNNKRKFVPPPTIFTPAVIPSTSIRPSMRSSFLDYRPLSLSSPSPSQNKIGEKQPISQSTDSNDNDEDSENNNSDDDSNQSNDKSSEESGDEESSSDSEVEEVIKVENKVENKNAMLRSNSLIKHVENQYPTAQVAFDFDASNDREISVPEGEFVNILKSDHSEWWLVMYKGKYGYIPRNYLVLDTDE